MHCGIIYVGTLCLMWFSKQACLQGTFKKLYLLLQLQFVILNNDISNYTKIRNPTSGHFTLVPKTLLQDYSTVLVFHLQDSLVLTPSQEQGGQVFTSNQHPSYMIASDMPILDFFILTNKFSD